MSKDTVSGTSAPAASEAVALIALFASNRATTDTRKPITSWIKLFEAFSKAKPPKTGNKNEQPGWCPAVFTDDMRRKANVETVFALVLDYDSGKTTPEEALAVWPGSLACTYTSWSHAVGKPRFRLIVPFSRAVTAEEYSRVWTAAAAKLAAAGQEIDTACKDPSRLWYLPCRRDEHFAVVIQDGQALDVNTLLASAAITGTPTEAISKETTRQSFLTTVKERSRLEDVVQPGTGWDKRTDDDWWCSSPLRSGDSTPSFHVEVSKQRWYDFGLSEGGDVFAYLQRLWGCDFKTALTRQAAAVGVQRPVMEFDDIGGIAVEEHDAQIVDRADSAPSTAGALDCKGPRFACTDLGNAERLVYREGHNIRFVPQWDKWIVWTGKKWALDTKKKVDRLAQVTVRSIYGEARDEADPDRRKSLADHAKRSEANARKVALLDQAKSLPGVPVAPDELDADPWLLNVQNGTLDLRTGELRPHRREDLLMMIAGTSYDPNATCPTYDRFLEDVQPDPEVRELIWTLDASSLSGEIRDHWLAYDYGAGRNGKTTHEEIMLRIFGDYGRKVPTELLTAKRGDAHPTEKTTLFRIRYAAASETEEGKVMNVAFIKQATGGDRISARRMREDFWEFEPTHHLHLSSNHKLIIRDTTDAIWARVLLIPWAVRIPPEKQDKQLGEKLKAEASGILAKLVHHCLAWQRNGLRIPDAVRVATQEYRTDMDVLGEFVNTWCIEDTRSTSAASHLYSVYKSWAEDGGEYVMSQTMFGRQLAERGFTKERCTKTGRVVWRGLRVRTSADDAPEPVVAKPATEYREPGAGMAVTEMAEFPAEKADAEQSEQFDREFGITAHEGAILGRTGIEPRTVQTVQPASVPPPVIDVACTMTATSAMAITDATSTALPSPQPTLIHDIITGTMFDVSTPEGEEAYREHLLSLV